MPNRGSELPAVISVSEMARRVGLSRSRFYDLVRAGVFPKPIYCIRTRRPMYATEQQVECLSVKASNIGVNGQYVLFYSPRDERPMREARRSGTTARIAANDGRREILSGLQALGMSTVTPQQVDSALRACFPNGWTGRDEGEVLRLCWSHLRQAGAA